MAMSSSRWVRLSVLKKQQDGAPQPRRWTEKAAALASTQALSIAINTFLALSAALILFPQRFGLHVGLWLVVTLLINLLRWTALCSRTVQRRLALTAHARLRLSSISNLAVGVCWAVLPALIMDFRSEDAPFVSIILCGLTAGAALQAGAYALPAILLSVPIATAMAVRLTLLGTSSGYVLAFDVLLYTGMIVGSSRAAERSFDQLVALRWTANALASDLKQKHQDALASADQLYRLANHDPLTGAANRAAFATRLTEWLESAKQKGGFVTLLLVDLDHFKVINDTLGHGVGDEVLKVVAARLSDFQGPDRFVARLGGDEFAVLVSDCCAQGEEAGVAESLIHRVSMPFSVRGQELTIGASVGVSRYPVDAVNADDLLARADLALYAAKDAGRHGWRVFDPALLSAAELARDVERDLPQALEDGSVQVWFQPQVEVLSGRLAGLEALLRWRHPTLGWISPPDVVVAAFKLRRSEALARLVIDHACTAVEQLDLAGHRQAHVAVNISPRELEQFDLCSVMLGTLTKRGADPRRLEVEITEEAILSNDVAIRTLADLRRSGVRLAMDDFGTGNSSIAYLRKLPIDRIKIDRSFVQDVAHSEGDRALTRAIVSMARSLGVEVLAEGVETHEQALVLRSLGCHLAQGYLYGAAAPLQNVIVRPAQTAMPS